MPRGYPGLTPGVNPRSQGMIPRRFKRKKNFVTEERKEGRTDGWTDRRVGQNSDLDEKITRLQFFVMQRLDKRGGPGDSSKITKSGLM